MQGSWEECTHRWQLLQVFREQLKEGHLSEVRRRGIAEYSLPDTRFPGSGDFGSGFRFYVTRETRDADDDGGALPEGLTLRHFTAGGSIMMTVALLFLLAVAASQVDLYLTKVTLQSGEADISDCPINFYGQEYKIIEVFFRPDSSFALCLKNIPNEPTQECLLVVNRGGADRMEVAQQNINKDPSFTGLPNIISSSNCVVQFYLLDASNDYIVFNLFKFGHQTVMSLETYVSYTLDTVEVRTEIGNLSIDSWSVNSNSFADYSEVHNLFYADISGCRQAGVFLPAGTSKRDPESCDVLNCNSSAQLFVEGCVAPEVCKGNTCVQPTFVCTVTGSTVIDFFNRVHSVPDRCAYKLMSSSEVEVYGRFRERHLKDVPFLDYLIIFMETEGVDIYLEQGGRVRVGDQILTLNTTAQLFHGLELSKDQTGVTAKIPNFKVHFDGNTAHVTGSVESLTGLCGNPTDESQTTSPRDSFVSNYSFPGCKIQHSEAINSTVDCSSTDLCGLMNQAPFTACHDHIDPEPYIAACTNTSCKYTPVDDLPCRYMEAYAEACSLKDDVTVEEWRSKANCSAALQASCLDQHCRDHEFCGQKLGEARCLCRALFASKYQSTDTIAEPTVCMHSSANVTLAECLLWDKGIDYSTLHLNDPDCKGHVDDQTHMVTFSFQGDACGTEVVRNVSHVIYKNQIRMGNSSLNETITRDNQVEIDFSCSFKRPDIQSVSIRIQSSSVFQHIETELWNYTVMMNAYTDAGFKHLVENCTDLQLDQRVWLQMKTEGLDNDLVTVVTDSCWATNQPSPDGGLPYYLVIDGCPNPADQTVEMKGNGLGGSNSFSFRMFEFVKGNNGGSSEIYLHCKLELCPKDPGCAPVCSGGLARKRRSSKSGYAKGGQALITMVWNN